ncbi:MAG TPA: hypothetical protein VI299_27000 [Polyangiales bacterium]
MKKLRSELVLSALACAYASGCAAPSDAVDSRELPEASDSADEDKDEDPRDDDEKGQRDSGRTDRDGRTGHDSTRDAGVSDRDSCSQDIDVVFVVDVSGSMVPALSKLMAEVSKVDEALQAKDLPSAPHYGLVTFVDDFVVTNGGAPYADIDALKAAVNAEVQATQLNPARQATGALEPNLSWPENSLDALYAAATDFQWRDADSTHRTIIHITDASFWNLDAVSSADGDPMGLEPAGRCSGAAGAIFNTCTMVSSQHSYDETIDALRDAKIWANTFAARTGGPPGTTPSPASHGAFRGIDVDVGIGFHEPYEGRPSIAMSSGGLAWDVDDVYDGVISLATPINEAIEATACMEYPLI